MGKKLEENAFGDSLDVQGTNDFPMSEDYKRILGWFSGKKLSYEVLKRFYKMDESITIIPDGELYGAIL
jgi:hypothetical protein